MLFVRLFDLRLFGFVDFLFLVCDCGAPWAFLLLSFQMKNSGGSNEYLQFMFLSRNKKINVYPCKPQFYCIKVGFRGQNYVGVFS